jgi:hypothetical protein
MLLSRRSYFDNDDLVQLTQAFDAACGDLAVAAECVRRAPLREHIADLIMRIACAGESNPATIRHQAVARFRS